MTSLTVLITAASRRVPLVRAFRAALVRAGVRGRVIVTDINPLSPAVFEADRAYAMPLATDPAYIPELLALCDAEGVGLAVPTIDDELPLFAAATPAFRRRGVLTAWSPPETARICNDKYLTSLHLAAHGIPVARAVLPGERMPDMALPLFIKPRGGRGGIGAFPVRSERELAFFADYVPDPVVQEYLDGPEFTIDVVCDGAGEPLAIVPRERVVIRAGVSDRGRTVKHPALIALAARVCRALHFVGPLNIQCRIPTAPHYEGRPVVFEINARFSGGIPLTIAAGADVPAMLVDLALGRPVAPRIGAFTDGLWMTNHETAIFLDETQLASLPLMERPARLQEAA
ncbi:MAG: ATP-grasp domain-containing protein [Vicinamibacterales bacterium]